MYTKLFDTLIHSTVWREEMHVKIVWITMLALADAKGDVWAAIPGLADAARVSVAQCEDALRRFQSPDPYSRTREHEGRRIEEIDGGWHLLNYSKYREIRDAEHRRSQVREAVQRHRDRRRRTGEVKSSVIKSKQRKSQSESDPESESESESTVGIALVELRSTLVPDTSTAEAQAASRNAKEQALKLGAEVVFAYWKATHGKTGRTLLDKKREGRLIARLRENRGDVSELLYAVDGALRDDFLMGREPKAKRAFNGIETIFRDRGQVERLVALISKQNSQHPFLEQRREDVS